MYQNLLLEINNGCATITLNRPDVFNALNADLLKELYLAFEHCNENAEVRVIVLTGSGKGFCAGQDIRTIHALQGAQFNASAIVRELYNPLISLMRLIPKPIVAKLNGVAAGAGCSLALACDMIIASELATLSQAFIHIGLVPDSGATYFLPRITGRIQAFELMALGDKITATQALALGMVNKVVDPELLDTTLTTIVERLVNSPRETLGMIKTMLNESYHSNLSDVLEQEAKMQQQAASSNDFKEGIQAFLEKRVPKYRRDA